MFVLEKSTTSEAREHESTLRISGYGAQRDLEPKGLLRFARLDANGFGERRCTTEDIDLSPLMVRVIRR